MDYCVMFVSDNNVFDTNAIDYMEYFFINLLKDSEEYQLYNVDQRNRVPNLNYFDKITYHMYLEQIDFLLKAEGVDFKRKGNFKSKTKTESVVINQQESKELDSTPELDLYKIYKAKSQGISASLKINSDFSFSILPGSILIKPSPKMSTWSDNGSMYKQITSSINGFLKEGKVKEKMKMSL